MYRFDVFNSLAPHELQTHEMRAVCQINPWPDWIGVISVGIRYKFVPNFIFEKRFQPIVCVVCGVIFEIHTMLVFVVEQYIPYNSEIANLEAVFMV